MSLPQGNKRGSPGIARPQPAVGLPHASLVFSLLNELYGGNRPLGQCYRERFGVEGRNVNSDIERLLEAAIDGVEIDMFLTGGCQRVDVRGHTLCVPLSGPPLAYSAHRTHAESASGGLQTGKHLRRQATISLYSSGLERSRGISCARPGPLAK